MYLRRSSWLSLRLDPYSWTWLLPAILLACVVAIWIWRLHRAFSQIRGVPGRKIQWADPFSLVATLLSPVYPPPGWFASYYGKFMRKSSHQLILLAVLSLFSCYHFVLLQEYERFHSTILSSVRPHSGKLYFWIADADTLKDIWSDRHLFTKPMEVYDILQIYGENLVSVEGSTWKRHKAIAAPAFNEANIALVWRTTLKTLREWFDELDESKVNTVDIEKCMIKMTLHVISAAGFGLHMPWRGDPKVISSGRRASFTETMNAAMHDIFTKVMVPSTIFNITARIPIPLLSARLNEVTSTFDELRAYLLEVVTDARNSIAEGKGAGDAALLRTLVAANMDTTTQIKRLSDDELLSNVFVFFLAGHETSSHALAFIFILLALYPDVQQRIYEEADKAWPNRSSTHFEDSIYKDDFPKLEYTLAAFREALRLFPAEPRLAKVANETTTVHGHTFTPNKDGAHMHGDVRRMPVAVPKGSIVIVDIMGVHHNPLHWGQDCKEFKPERFIDTDDYKWPRHAFLPFAAGARGCIGSRFAITESVCMIANLTRRFEIVLPENVLKMERDSQVKYMTRWTQLLTMTPNHCKLRLRRRQL